MKAERAVASLLRRKALAIAVVSCLAGYAQANPINPTVISGAATFAASGKNLTVTNTPGAIINWQGFSVGKDEVARFIQQNAQSAVLNRVVSQQQSAILGQLLSNGRVYLINPNGITVGAGARIDTAGFVASSLALSSNDALAGKFKLQDTGNSGKVINNGTITTPSGGFVYLVAPNAENKGIITSPKGQIILAAGKTAELVDSQSPDLRVQLTAPENTAINVGKMVAEAGSIGIFAGAIKQSGLISANSATVDAQGHVVLRAKKDIVLDAGSRTEANGLRGGGVTVQAEGGTLLASGVVEAKGAGGLGGTVQLLGKQVGLIDDARVDASGDRGGGTVLVGGDRHGENPAVQNGQRTYLGPAVTVKADAVDAGDGGKVIVWSDDTTRFDGSITARGGAHGGDGGFAEVSGKKALVYRGNADLSAPNGDFGTLLLDPRDITIQASGADDSQLSAGVPSGEVAGQILFGTDTTTDFTLTASTLSASSANVVLQAQRDIDINAPVTLNDDLSFVAQAGHDINVDAALTTRGVSAGKGTIHLEADSPHSGSFFDGKGAVNVNAPVNSCGGVAGGCLGGNITLIGGGNSSPTGGFNLGADVQAGDGGINVALSDSSSNTLNFLIGAGGNTQLSSNDTGYLLATGPLVLGRATTAGTDGYGAGAISLLVNSLQQLNATPMTLSASSGSSLTLTAGGGGITLDRSLTTYQQTVVDTTGAFTIGSGSTLNTSNNDLVISASSVVADNASITTGTGTFGCTGTGCPVGTATVVSWNVDADGDWMTGSNWSLGRPPSSTQVALIDRPLRNAYTISLGSAGQSSPLSTAVGLLVNYEHLSLAGNASNPTTLNISSDLTYNGSGSTSSFNYGTMTLDHAVLGGTGLLSNAGSLALSGSAVTAALAQGVGGTMFANGTNTISGPLSMAAGTFEVQSGTTTLSGDNNYAGAVTVDSGASLALTGGNQSAYIDSTTSGTGRIDGLAGSTVDVAGAAIDLNLGTTASLSTLNLSGGSVGGQGSLTVAKDFNQSGTGTLGTAFTDLALTRSLGTFVAPALGATHNIALTTTGANDMVVSGALTAGNQVRLLSGGALTLNDTVTANGSGDAIVASASTAFANNAGAGAFSAPGGRWLQYAANPSTSTFGSLDSGNTAVWNATYGTLPPASVSQAGNRYLFALRPTVTFTSANVSKTYGQNATAVLASAYSVSGLQAGVASAFLADSNSTAFTGAPSVTSAGAASSAHVASGPYAITAAAGSLTAVNGYALAFASPGQLTINPALVSLSGSRVYDGGTGFAASAFGIGGTITTGLGETLTVTGTAGVASKNVGTQALSSLPTLADGPTGLASDYTLSGGTHTGTITPAALTVGATGIDKVYDRTTAAVVTLTDNRVSGDQLTAGYTAADFDSKNAGTGKTVSVTGIDLSGADAGNYTFNTTATTKANITAKTVTVTGFAASDKTYDGTVAATVAGTALGGVISGDVVSLDGLTGSFADKNVGTNKTVSVSGGVLGGGDAGNYQLSSGSGSTTASITAKALALNAVSASKTYDGTVNSAVSPTAVGLVGGDTVSLLGQQYASKDVLGTGGSTLNVKSGYVVNDGNAGGNYTVTLNSAAGTITPAALIVTANDAGKTFDGIAYRGGNGVSYGGFVGGESETVLGGMLSYGGTSQGAVNVGSYSIVPFGLTASNYAISFVGGVLSIAPTPALSVPVQAAVNGTTNLDIFVVSNNQGSNATPIKAIVGGADLTPVKTKSKEKDDRKAPYCN